MEWRVKGITSSVDMYNKKLRIDIVLHTFLCNTFCHLSTNHAHFHINIIISIKNFPVGFFPSHHRPFQKLCNFYQSHQAKQFCKSSNINITVFSSHYNNIFVKKRDRAYDLPSSTSACFCSTTCLGKR